LFVLRGERIELQVARWEVYAHAVAQLAALLHQHVHLRGLHLHHPHAHPTVVEVDEVAHAHVLRERVVPHGHPVALGLGAAHQHEVLAGQHLAGGEVELAHADLGAAEVAQDGHGLLPPRAHLADGGDGPRVVVVGAVREVEPRHVHARRDERVDALGRIAGGADGAHDLRATGDHRAEPTRHPPGAQVPR
jgi:hypothetical protein